MKTPSNIKIRWFLLLFLFLSIMIPSSLAMLSIHSFTRRTIREEYTDSYMESISAEIENNFSLLIFQLNLTYLQLITNQAYKSLILDTSLSGEERYAELASAMDAILTQTGITAIIDYLGPDGELYRFGADPSDFPAPDAQFADTLGHVRFTFSPRPVYYQSRNYFAVGRKLYNYTSNMDLGYAVLYLDENNLSSLYAVSSDEQSLFFISSDGMVLFHPDETYIGARLYLPGELFSMPGGNWTYMQRELKDASIQNPLTITCILSNETLFRRMDRMLVLLFVSYGLILVIAFGISTLISSRLIRHLSRLRSRMEHFSLEDRTPLTQSPANEISSLEASFDKMSGEIRRLVADIEQAKDQEHQAQLSALQSQINPHFIYNALDSISWKAKENRQYEIDDMIVTLATYFRLGLHKGDSIITIRHELEHVKSYLQIETMRFPNLFRVRWDIDASAYDCLTPKIILQPVVENCIKHGFREMRQGGLIGIRNFRQGDDIVFEISDNGRGLSGEKDSDAASSKTGGYGLYNINERLTRHFGADYGLRITDNPGGGTLVVLRIKYRREDNSVR